MTVFCVVIWRTLQKLVHGNSKYDVVGFDVRFRDDSLTTRDNQKRCSYATLRIAQVLGIVCLFLVVQTQPMSFRFPYLAKE